MDQLHQLTITQAYSLLRSKEITSRELTRSVLDRIARINSKVNAFITICEDSAMARAAMADERIQSGNGGPLTGIPISVKDVLCTRGIRTTCASKILEDFVPPYDAAVVEKLNNAGTVMVGKVNMDEFAMGSSNENSGFMITKNPWDVSRIPGGSSGGSAVSVSADMCLGSIGSDTGGSIRQPASHCSVAGLKPTYGRVSRYGLVAFASSLDQIGPIGKCVSDCAILMNALAGYDPKDSTSVNIPVPDYSDLPENGLKGVKIGIPKEYEAAEGLAPDVSAAVDRAVVTLEKLGAEKVSVSLPHTRYAVAAYYVIAPSEASSNLARYDGVKYGFRDPAAENLIGMYKQTRSNGFGKEVKRRIIIGTYCLSAGYYDAYYGKASQVRTMIMEDFKRAFTHCDAILSPVAPEPPFRIGEKTDDPLTMYLSDIFTLSANLAGIPGISIPCGFSGDGLPIGLQIMGKHFDEHGILKIASEFERATDFNTKKPDI